MASILQVEELRGPTSGANANKVIIPSGQTLDASAGGMTLPAGVGGKLLQVKSATKTDTTSTGSTSFIDTGLSVTITPSNASNKILLMASLTNGSSSTASTSFRFVQDGLPVVVGDATGNRIQGTTTNGDNSSYHCHSSSMQGEVTANTTNATTFKVQYVGQNGHTSSINRNTSFSNDSENYNGVFTSTLTVMEIAG